MSSFAPRGGRAATSSCHGSRMKVEFCERRKDCAVMEEEREKEIFRGFEEGEGMCVFNVLGGERNGRLNLNAPFSILEFLGAPLDSEYFEQSSELFSELVFAANFLVTQDNKGNIIRSQ